MNDPAFWAAWLQAEWTEIAKAPISFVVALIGGWLLGWLILGLWYKRDIRIAKGLAGLNQREAEIERGQKEGLRKALLDLNPNAPVVAMEMAYGDPEIQKVVTALGRGGTISTPVNPTVPDLVRPITNDEIKKVAVVLYTSANGLSQVASVQPAGVTVSSSTALGVQVADYLDRRATKKSDG